MSREIDRRKAEYVAWVAERFARMEPELAPTDGRLWALNHARLVMAEGTASDQEIRPTTDAAEASRFFEAAKLTGDPDIYFIRFLNTLLDFQHSPLLSDAAKAHLIGILTAWPRTDLSTMSRWPPIHTENHDLMHLTIVLFAKAFDREDLSEQVRAVDKHLTLRFERGWVEWNSPCYQYHYSNPLIVLAQHAPVEGLRAKAEDLLNVMLAERLVMGVDGYLGGPALRCRTADGHDSLTARKIAYLEDNRYDGFLPTVWLAPGLGEARFDYETARVEGLEPAGEHYASGNEPRLKQDEGMLYACTDLTPHPAVLALASEASAHGPWTYTGQRYLGWPRDENWATQKWQPGAIYYYNTPHISMGSMHSNGWSHQVRHSCVMFGADPSRNLRVEVIAAGVTPNKRRHEARGQVVQHENWMLGQGTLFEDGGITARRVGDWDLYRVGKGLCARYALPNGYHVLQVSDLDQYESEAAFVEALPMPVMEGHEVRGRLTNGDAVAVDTRDMSIKISGKARPHPPAMLHDSGWMRSEYGSAVITIETAAGSFTFDGSRPVTEAGR